MSVKLGKKWLTAIPQYLFIIFVASFITAISLLIPSFLSGPNIADIMISGSILGVIALGQMFVLIAGGVDLAVGHVAGFAGLIAGFLMVERKISLLAACLIALSASIGIECVAGILVGYLGVSSFIASLGNVFVLIGLRYWVTKGITVMLLPRAFRTLGIGQVGIIPVPVLLVIVLYLVNLLIVHWTPIGRYTQATGRSLRAAFLGGVNVRLYTFLSFAIAGILCAIGGFMLVARAGVANVDIGDGYMLDSFAACMLGGALTRGRFTPTGTLIASLLVVMLVAGLNMLGVNPEWVYLSKAALILVSFLIHKLPQT
ncbi:MAG: ABC transporter permease [Candidatus Hadarchaeum sp.]|uniref:ABC transporter permease n=1 Tax=Candidatus Hadarchaeum sp. TaxID=2883567 RepID=UPI003180E590